jgi:prepilin-type N-terminal cleavage/methylation domain-containing protein
MKLHRPHHRGFTLAEALISMSIMAALLVAMAGAMAATANSVVSNDQFYRSLQQARAAENLIMTEVRRCASVTSQIGTPPCTTTAIQIVPPTGDPDFSGDTIDISYNSSADPNGHFAANTITVYDTTTLTYTTLATNVTSATFNVSTGPNLAGQTVVGSVALKMTVQNGDNQVTLSDSMSPRANLTSLYQ